MRTPLFARFEFLDAVAFNAAAATVSGDFQRVSTAALLPGLVRPDAISLAATGLVLGATLPAPFGVMFGNGVIADAHGVLTGVDTNVYTVNLAGSVPASGSATVYVLASLTAIQQQAYQVVGPPLGHPNYTPGFVPFTAYGQVVDSLALAASLAPPDNVATFELCRTTLSVGATGIGAIDVSHQYLAAPQALSNTIKLVASKTLALADVGVAQEVTSNGVFLTLPPAATFVGRNFPVVSRTVSGCVIQTSLIGDLIYGAGNTPGIGLNAFNLANGAAVTLVSDGASWQIITAGGLPQPVRIQLTGNTTFFVSPAGSDTNSGLTSGSPFLTIQHAINVLQNSYDFIGYTATVQLADGTYAGFTNPARMVGQSGPASLIINGNSGSPTNVVIDGGASDAAQSSGGQFQIQNCKLQATSGGGGCITAGGTSARVFAGVGITFGASTQSKISASQGGSVVINAPYTDTGNAGYHLLTSTGGQVVNGTTTLHTVVGNPTYSIGFAVAQIDGVIAFGTTAGPAGGYTGTAIGNKFTVIANGVISTNGGANFFPGTVAGTQSTGGQYV